MFHIHCVFIDTMEQNNSQEFERQMLRQGFIRMPQCSHLPFSITSFYLAPASSILKPPEMLPFVAATIQLKPYVRIAMRSS